MTDNNYWFVLFNLKSWNEFIENKKNVFGFPNYKYKSVMKIKNGDLLLCYLSGISRFVGLYKVTREMFKDKEIIWTENVYPNRLEADPLIQLTPETAVQLFDLKEDLNFIKKSKTPTGWTYKVRTSPAKWDKVDGDVVTMALTNASKNQNATPLGVKRSITFQKGM